MWISGTGITQFTANIQVDFRPMTRLALKWFQLADGNWACTDRGSSADVYRAQFMIRHWEYEVIDFLNEIQANRDEYSNVLTLSNFASNEHIFGADIDHSGSINASITRLERIRQTSWMGRSLVVEVQALSPSTTGSASLPTLEHHTVPWDADADWTLNSFDTYDGTFSYQEHDRDVGLFKGNFIFSDAEMINMRRYIATQRDATISVSDISGVEYPFGPRRTNTYPLSTKIISWRDRGMIDVNRWGMEVTFAEVA